MAVLIINRYIGLFGTDFMQVLYLGRAPRTKKTLPDFHEKYRVTRHSRVFRGLTGSQRTLGIGVSQLGSQSKGHHRKFKVPITRPKRCLKDICLPNHQLMVTSAKVYLGVDSHSSQLIK